MIDMILPLTTFAFAASITPGPNNLMLMASGANFGWRGTLPHMMGVVGGFALMTAIVGAGLLQVLELFPQALLWLKVVCGAFVLYLAWKIATAAPLGEGGSAHSRPLRFIEAAAFQWVNPKAIVMSLTTVTTYASDKTLTDIALVVLVFVSVNLPCVATWVLIGQQLRTWLQNPTRLRMFNCTMALLLIASMVPALGNLRSV